MWSERQSELTLYPRPDRDYRSAIWQLETLRLQRARVATSARTFLIDFASELSDMLQEVLDMHASSLFNVGRSMLNVRR